MEKQIGKNELTCNDCLKCDNLGLGVYFCDDTIDIISPDQPACQLILRKGNARRTNTCETCKNYKQDVLDGPATCKLSGLIKWPLDHCKQWKRNPDYKH